ncbi:MAG: GNAT family N-acetyltransferase [Candidatus Dormibacteraeota bacterium]|nr:GNAT family N-acetyltransferase [Candidatus Dormibacteraeota bacterium]MBV9526241.1 GNAT family N-acetyltransferase [Candidatus Dormibacteraeota bacterium]
MDAGTAELVIRLWEPRDAESLHRAVLESVDHLRPWVPFASREPITLSQRRTAMKQWQGWLDDGGDRMYGLFLGDQVVGGCGLHRRIGPGGLEIGYWVHPGFVRRGYATAAARTMTDEAFALDGIDRVEIWHQEANVPSGRVPAALGFAYVGLRRRETSPDVEWMVWRQSRDGWRAGPG